MTAVGCDLCYGNRHESLGHILQQCLAVAGQCLARHNGILERYITTLQRAGYHTLREPAIPTDAGVQYPDIVVADAAAGNLFDAHMRKVAYYNTLRMRAFVEDLTGSSPIFSSFTMSWRGVLSVPSYNTWVSLGLPRGALKLLIVHGMEEGVRIAQCFKRTSGARVRRVDGARPV
ncbi:Retrovirus-related Pol polyprotein from type-1 retrotransposable element R2 [Portunus trituberculatus]|uniref:Retrovirus-related Pol polyprotein from type-1 retrotransposable element R2 n=1 Tax=Portunus trituberculatus TaxID=210409 RepID=A0A5B7GS43_PORTR|nr:Retrovirus-related Pol polyprotein from type-1 retrotransposable element R2 [Portunus trituberculatus]